MTSQSPEYGGCPWPIDTACVADAWDALEESVQNQALALASSTLQRLTAYRVGNCPVTVRPILNRGCCFIPGTYDITAFSPGVNVQGHWVNDCGVSQGCDIWLPPPVGRVDEVRVDGTVLNPGDYRLAENRIVWQGEGDCPFWESQDVHAPLGEEGTMSVTYLNAYPVDSMGATAVAVLALEFARACGGAAGKCRLPNSVRAIVRQGVTYEINPGLFPDGFTGVREVDAYIALWNPQGSRMRQQPQVYSPDMKKFEVVRPGAVVPVYLNGGGADG